MNTTSHIDILGNLLKVSPLILLGLVIIYSIKYVNNRIEADKFLADVGLVIWGCTLAFALIIPLLAALPVAGRIDNVINSLANKSKGSDLDFLGLKILWTQFMAVFSSIGFITLFIPLLTKNIRANFWIPLSILVFIGAGNFFGYACLLLISEKAWDWNDGGLARNIIGLCYCCGMIFVLACLAVRNWIKENQEDDN